MQNAKDAFRRKNNKGITGECDGLKGWGTQKACRDGERTTEVNPRIATGEWRWWTKTRINNLGKEEVSYDGGAKMKQKLQGDQEEAKMLVQVEQIISGGGNKQAKESPEKGRGGGAEQLDKIQQQSKVKTKLLGATKSRVRMTGAG
jgi:hypothetical protein